MNQTIEEQRYERAAKMVGLTVAELQAYERWLATKTVGEMAALLAMMHEHEQRTRKGETHGS